MAACSGGMERSWRSDRVAQLLEMLAVRAHAVRVAVDVDDGGAVQEPIEHGGGDHGVSVAS